MAAKIMELLPVYCTVDKTSIMWRKNTFKRVQKILAMIQHCKEEDIPCTGQTFMPPGQQPLIPTDSQEAQIIADCLEEGDSIHDTTFQ